MYRLISTLILLGMMISGIGCDNEEGVSMCIETKIENFKKDNADRGHTYIMTFVLEGRTYYIFDHGIAFDAQAEVYDESCEQICTYGGFTVVPDTSCEPYQDYINQATRIWPE